MSNSNRNSTNNSNTGSLTTMIVEETMHFSFTELCQACWPNPSAPDDESWLLALVDEGVLQPTGQGPQDWVFEGSALRTARSALRLGRDLELNPQGVALVLDLLAQNELLRARLRRAGLG